MKRAVLTALAVLFAFPAFAAPNCADTADVESILTQRYGEEVVSEGRDREGALIQFWGNPETGSWTITGSTLGITCVLAQGTAFKRVPLEPNV